MKPALIALLVLFQASPDNIEPPPFVAPDPATDYSLDVTADFVPGNSANQAADECLATLSSSPSAEHGSRVSAFQLFNHYPPKRDGRDPGSVDIEPPEPSLSKLMDCLPGLPFPFAVLADGLLTEGTLALLSPVAAWELGDGYIAFYLYKNYEVVDGEGDSIQILAVTIDASGKALHAIPAASSWYEYEGSIRIRDFLFLGGEFVTIEEVFDPRHRDESGNVLDYLDAPEASVIQKHQIPF